MHLRPELYGCGELGRQVLIAQAEVALESIDSKGRESNAVDKTVTRICRPAKVVGRGVNRRIVAHLTPGCPKLAIGENRICMHIEHFSKCPAQAHGRIKERIVFFGKGRGPVVASRHIQE